MNVNTSDGRIRRYGFEVVANVATIAAIQREIPRCRRLRPRFPVL
jgi:hypothetical protein